MTRVDLWVLSVSTGGFTYFVGFASPITQDGLRQTLPPLRFIVEEGGEAVRQQRSLYRSWSWRVLFIRLQLRRRPCSLATCGRLTSACPPKSQDFPGQRLRVHGFAGDVCRRRGDGGGRGGGEGGEGKGGRGGGV